MYKTVFKISTLSFEIVIDEIELAVQLNKNLIVFNYKNDSTRILTIILVLLLLDLITANCMYKCLEF